MPAILKTLGVKLLGLIASKLSLEVALIYLEAKAQSYRAETEASPDKTDDAYGVAAVEAAEALKKFIAAS